jgi:hypothetical protein
MKNTANGWCGACRTGTHVAREGAERMWETQTFVDQIQAYQNWAGGAFERIMADGVLTGKSAVPLLSRFSGEPSATEKD